MHQLATYASQPTPRLPSLYDLGDVRAGTLEVFIASRQEEIEASQRLRYEVFFKEMGAPVTPAIAKTHRDADAFDEVCDHLLVVEHQSGGSYRVVGTYRLLRREAMRKIGRFYTDSEYDISRIHHYPGEILELGRSCVDPEFRNRAVMQLLWRGIGAYVARFNIELMFGCASFHGTNPDAHAMALSYLHHYHLAPEALRPSAQANLYVEMNRMPKAQVDVKEAFNALPALIKGYMRLNSAVGLGAVIDPEYNTTDVSIVLKTNLLTEKYVLRYGKDFAAQKL